TPRPLQIIPTPRQFRRGDGRYAVGPQTRLFVFDSAADRAAEVLRRTVKARFGWDWELAPGVAGNVPAGGINFLPREKDPKPHADADAGAESYAIRVTDEHATVYAGDAAGYAYGAASLAQMIRTS